MRIKTVALSSFVATPLLFGAQPAQAVLTYTIYESGGNVVMDTSGSLNLPSIAFTGFSTCIGSDIKTANSRFCTGQNRFFQFEYAVIGPTSISATAGTVDATASSSTGLATFLNGTNGSFFIPTSYASGTPIVGSSTFNSQTLAGLGFTTTGLIGTWTLTGTGGGDTIEVRVSAPPGPSGTGVPGPLPLFGAAAAFGYSRRLRRRVSLSRSASPSATLISA